MTNAAPPTQPKALVPSAVDPDVGAALQIYERIKPLKDALGVQNLTDSELQVFAYVARYTGLDPFTKQIYAIKRGGRVTHQTGIDGYRSVAERTRQYAGSDEATYEECSCGEADSPPQHPAVARVVVRRILDGGHVVEQTGVARWHELKPPHTKFENAREHQDAMWWRQPYNQLAKCAEANGLRKAFPRVLGGVYISDEMGGAGPVIEGTATEVAPASAPRPTAADRVAARRQAAQSQQKPAPTAPPADDVVEGVSREIPVEPDWMSGAMGEASDAPAPEVAAAADPGDTDVAELIRNSAEASGIQGPMTAPQGERLRTLLGGLNGTGIVPLALAYLWGEEGAKALTAPRAQALLNQAESVGTTAFVEQLRGLAARQAAQ